MARGAAGPIVFAYDGSDLAKAAIQEAGRQLTAGRQAIVLTVWQPFNVGFVPPRKIEMNAAAADEVRSAAEQTAAQGAELAEAAGFAADGMAREAAPARKGIVEVADEQDASLIVLGSHGRSGLADVLIGSVAQDVAAHSRRPVLIVHRKK
jgi:nucleotide-binding universal stress UspA family protein